MITKHCPYCDNTALEYVINIFKKRNDEGYYSGEVQCSNCKKEFTKDDIKIRVWKECKEEDLK